MNRAKLAKLLPAGIVGVVVAASFIVGPGLVSTLASCGSATLAANPVSPHVSGGTIVLTGTGACGGYGGGGGYGYLANVPNFRFWELDPGSRWSMVRDYSPTATYNWNTAGLAAGTYKLEVDVRSADEPSTVAYDTVASLTYVLTAPAACTGAALATNPAGTAATGSAVLMTGSSATCSNPLYKFWVRDPGRAWSIVQNYSSITTHTWGPVGTYYMGTYNMEVDVRDASRSTTYDSVTSGITYTLVGCSAGTLVATGSGVHGTAVTLTATSTCPASSTGVQYRFWIFDANGTRWSMVRDYSATATYSWAAGNITQVGTYKIEVDIRDKGSLETYEHVVNNTYVTTS